MNRQLNFKYNNAISEIANWQYTTYVRTHYNMKPYVADNMVQNLLKSTDLIQGIYFTLEDDTVIYGGGTNDTFIRNINSNINHLHLLFAMDENVKVSTLRKKVTRRITKDGVIKTIPQVVEGELALRDTIVKGLRLNQKAVGDVQTVRSKRQVVKYINKHMSNTQAHHNYFFKEN